MNLPINLYYKRILDIEYMENETKLDLDNDRRRHGINNREKIELFYVADMENLSSVIRS